MTATVRGISTDGRSGSIDQEFERGYSVTYLVTTDDKNDGPAQVRVAFGIPAIGSVYTAGNDFDATAIVTGKSVSQRESPFEWEVQVTYSTNVDEEPEEAPSPLDEPPDITWGFQDRRILVPGRYNDAGAPDSQGNFQLGITNPAGEFYDPQPEMDISEPILTVKRNVASIDVATMMALANTVNSGSFYGADSRQLRLKPPTAQNAFDKQIGQYWAVTYQLVYKWDTWDIQVLNQGLTYRDDSGDLQEFEAKKGGPRVGLQTSTGGALNSSETELANKGAWTVSGNAPTFTRYRVYREVDFNALGIL